MHTCEHTHLQSGIARTESHALDPTHTLSHCLSDTVSHTLGHHTAYLRTPLDIKRDARRAGGYQSHTRASERVRTHTGSWESKKDGSNELMHIVSGHGWITDFSDNSRHELKPGAVRFLPDGWKVRRPDSFACCDGFECDGGFRSVLTGAMGRGRDHKKGVRHPLQQTVSILKRRATTSYSRIQFKLDWNLGEGPPTSPHVPPRGHPPHVPEHRVVSG